MGQGFSGDRFEIFLQNFGRPLTRFGRPARSARPCCAPHSGERSKSARAREGQRRARKAVSVLFPSAYAEGLQGGLR